MSIFLKFKVHIVSIPYFFFFFFFFVRRKYCILFGHSPQFHPVKQLAASLAFCQNFFRAVLEFLLSGAAVGSRSIEVD